MYRKWHSGVGAVDRAAGGTDEVLGVEVAAGLQNVQKAGDVSVHVSLWVFQRVTHTGLSRQVNDSIRPVFFKRGVNARLIFEVQTQIGEARVIGHSRQAGFLDIYVVVVVEVIHSDNLVAARQQA